MQEALKDFLIQVGEIERYFDGVVPINLWRAKKRESHDSLFGLVDEPVTRRSGHLRPADITVDTVKGVKWVRCRPSPRGISVFDKPNTFKGSSWQYYRIPKGTKIPAGLAIIRDQFNRRLGAVHYTIAPAWDMPLENFKRLLNALAINTKREVA